MYWGRYRRSMNRLVAVGAGGMLLLTGGCTVDDAVLTEVLNLVLEAFLSALTSA